MANTENYIYTVSVFDGFRSIAKNSNIVVPANLSVIGFFQNRNNAIHAVKNDNHISENSSYRYALIEEVREGLYGCTPNRWFYKLVHNELGEMSDSSHFEEIEEPGILRHVIGFSMA